KAAQGRASFVPLTEMEQLPLVPEAGAWPAPEDTVRAVDVVACAPEHDRVRNYLLADVFLCETLAAALALWARNPGERTFVSTDGEVVDKEGVVSGGALEGVADGLLHKRREVQELADTVQELEARLRALQADLSRARERAASVQAEVTKAKVSNAAIAERREGVGRSLQRLLDSRSEVESRREKLRTEIDQGKERDAALQAKGQV